MRKNILHSLLFLLPLAVLVMLLGPVFAPKNNTAEAGMLETDPIAILSQPENSIDLLFLGDSEAYSGFVPMELWQDYGIASFVCACVDQKPYETEEFLKTALERQSPKVVVLETNVLYRVYSRTDRIVPAAQQMFPVLRYHSRWKSLTLRDFQAPEYTGEYPDRGYHLLLSADPREDLEAYMAPTDAREALSGANLRSLRNIHALCEKNNIRLILYSVPSPENWNMARHNTMEDLARELGVLYLDGNLESRDIDWNLDTYDNGDHLNYYGAAKITRWLGDFLWDGLPDHRGEAAYAAWDRDLAALPERIQAKMEETKE